MRAVSKWPKKTPIIPKHRTRSGLPKGNRETDKSEVKSSNSSVSNVYAKRVADILTAESKVADRQTRFIENFRDGSDNCT